MPESAMTALVPTVKIKRQEPLAPLCFTDTVASEFVLELTINQRIVRLVTCSNSMLEEFVIGHLYSEGYIREMEDILSIEFSDDGAKAQASIRDAGAALGRTHAAAEQIVTTGSRSGRFPREAENLRAQKDAKPPRIDPLMVMERSEALLRDNPWFDATGALHSAGLSVDGAALRYVSVDLGRHNAVDKTIGAALKDGVELKNSVLFSTGRIPTDMMWKVVRSGIPAVVSRGSVTKQAIELAQAHGVTLCGFSRGERINIYTAYAADEQENQAE